MIKPSIIRDEEGSAMIFALMILAILTVLGISSTSTTDVELKIVVNEKQYQRDFYVAESGWKFGAYWLQDKESPPAKVNSSASFTQDQLNLVRNFGNAGENSLNNPPADGTEDGTIGTIPYWYNLQYDRKEVVAGSGSSYRNFFYIVNSNANKKQEIEVRVSKIF